jgi:hypothetical protein
MKKNYTFYYRASICGSLEVIYPLILACDFKKYKDIMLFLLNLYSVTFIVRHFAVSLKLNGSPAVGLSRHRFEPSIFRILGCHGNR